MVVLILGYALFMGCTQPKLPKQVGTLDFWVSQQCLHFVHPLFDSSIIVLAKMKDEGNVFQSSSDDVTAMNIKLFLQ